MRIPLKNGKIKYFDRNGYDKETEIDWSLGYKNYPSTYPSTKVSGITNGGQPTKTTQPTQPDEPVLQMF